VLFFIFVKPRDRRIRGLGPEPVGGAPPVSITGTRPTPTLAAQLGPTATPTKAAVLAAFAYWIPEHEAETEEAAAAPVTVLVMGRRNIVSAHEFLKDLNAGRFKSLLKAAEDQAERTGDRFVTGTGGCDVRSMTAAMRLGQRRLSAR